jgi:hypothetical protein
MVHLAYWQQLYQPPGAGGQMRSFKVCGRAAAVSYFFIMGSTRSHFVSMPALLCRALVDALILLLLVSATS